MTRLLTLLVALAIAVPAAAEPNGQLRKGVVNHIKRLDPDIVMPPLGAHDLAVLKNIVDDDVLRDDEKRSMVRHHLRKVERFGGDTRGVIFGFGRIGVRSGG